MPEINYLLMQEAVAEEGDLPPIPIAVEVLNRFCPYQNNELLIALDGYCYQKEEYLSWHMRDMDNPYIIVADIDRWVNLIEQEQIEFPLYKNYPFEKHPEIFSLSSKKKENKGYQTCYECTTICSITTAVSVGLNLVTYWVNPTFICEVLGYGSGAISGVVALVSGTIATISGASTLSEKYHPTEKEYALSNFSQGFLAKNSSAVIDRQPGAGVSSIP